MSDAVMLAHDETPEGQGLPGIAFHSGAPAVSNDFLDDPRLQLWHELARDASLRSAAAIPINRDQRPVGVLFLCSAEKRSFDDEIASVHYMGRK